MEWYSVYIDVYGEPLSSPYGDEESKYQTIVFKKTIIPHNIKDRKEITKYIVVLHDINTGIIKEDKSFKTEDDAFNHAEEMAKIST
jgi:hypothetical protein